MLTRNMAYLGGRFVLGSGRTWPHDFRFLAGFFSVLGADPGVISAGVEIDAADPASAVASPAGVEGTTSCLGSEKEEGVMASMGSIVFGGVAVAENNEGYISPGVESSDSAGDVSNLMFGEACSFHVAILTANLYG